MAGTLIIPRVVVFWGKTNLSAYTGEDFKTPTPLVYDVEVTLPQEGTDVSGQMKWNPTGPGFKVYEQFLKEKIDETIKINIFYPNGKNLAFEFVWKGQRIEYGNNMTVQVELCSQLAGDVNGSVASTAQAYDKGAAITTHLETITKKYGLDSKIYRFTDSSKKYAEKVKAMNSYTKDRTFSSSLSQILQEIGDYFTVINIGETYKAIFPPYSWEKDIEVIDASSIKLGDKIDGLKRYGFILGPGIIDSVSRDSQWQPPQTQNTRTGGKPRLPQKKDEKPTQNPPAKPEEKTKESRKKPKATTGPSRSTAVSVKFQDNKQGPIKTLLRSNEKTAKLTASMFLCPLLVGIKPNDIVYLPSLSGDYIEDWIVDNVSYRQTDGGVEVSISATRIYGTSENLNKKNADKFLKLAKSKGLVGKEASLEKWSSYAWTDNLSKKA